MLRNRGVAILVADFNARAVGADRINLGLTLHQGGGCGLFQRTLVVVGEAQQLAVFAIDQEAYAGGTLGGIDNQRVVAHGAAERAGCLALVAEVLDAAENAGLGNRHVVGPAFALRAWTVVDQNNLVVLGQVPRLDFGLDFVDVFLGQGSIVVGIVADVVVIERNKEAPRVEEVGQVLLGGQAGHANELQVVLANVQVIGVFERVLAQQLVEARIELLVVAAGVVVDPELQEHAGRSPNVVFEIETVLVEALELVNGHVGARSGVTGIVNCNVRENIVRLLGRAGHFHRALVHVAILVGRTPDRAGIVGELTKNRGQGADVVGRAPPGSVHVEVALHRDAHHAVIEIIAIFESGVNVVGVAGGVNVDFVAGQRLVVAPEEFLVIFQELFVALDAHEGAFAETHVVPCLHDNHRVEAIAGICAGNVLFGVENRFQAPAEVGCVNVGLGVLEEEMENNILADEVIHLEGCALGGVVIVGAGVAGIEGVALSVEEAVELAAFDVDFQVGIVAELAALDGQVASVDGLGGVDRVVHQLMSLLGVDGHNVEAGVEFNALANVVKHPCAGHRGEIERGAILDFAVDHNVENIAGVAENTGRVVNVGISLNAGHNGCGLALGVGFIELNAIFLGVVRVPVIRLAVIAAGFGPVAVFGFQNHLLQGGA